MRRREHRQRCSFPYGRNGMSEIKICPVCGSEFESNSKTRKYCSSECRRRVKRDKEQDKRRRRRQLTGDQRGKMLSIDRVYERDGGICQICGLPVPLHCDRNDGWSRTMDHIDPVMLGGSHSYGNCQLAHRICNCIKFRAGEGFAIDWAKKVEEEPGRWTRRLARLDSLLAEEKPTPTERFVGSQANFSVGVNGMLTREQSSH